MSDNDPIQKSLETYEQNRQTLMSRGIGRYVLISGERIVGDWETYEDALKAGYDEFGIDGEFLVKKIQGPVDGIQFFTRDIKCQA